MTIHHQMQEIALPNVRDPDALCCAFVTGILPQPENPPAGGKAAPTTGRLAPTAPVQPSNGPTDRAVCADAANGAAPAGGAEHPDELVPGGAGRDVAPAIARFHAELRRGLPVEFSFNVDDQVIFEPLTTQWVCGPIRVVSYPRRPMARDGLSRSNSLIATVA